MRTRANKVTVYMDDQELARLNEMVSKTLLNREQFLRAMVAGVTIREAPPAPLWQTVCRMKQAAEDIKEIADNVYFADAMDEAFLRQTVKDVRTCVEEVRRLCFPEEWNKYTPEIPAHRHRDSRER